MSSNGNKGGRLHDVSVSDTSFQDVQTTTTGLKRSNARARQHPPKDRAKIPPSSSIREASPSGASSSIRKQSPHHHSEQILGGSQPHASISEGPRSSQKDIPIRVRDIPTPSPLAGSGGGPHERRGTTGSPSGHNRPRLRLDIPKSREPNPPIEVTKPLEPPQEMTKGHAGSKPGKQGNSRLREDLPEGNNKPGKNTGSTDQGRTGEPQRSIWNKFIVNRNERQAAMSQCEKDTAAEMAPFRENDAPEDGIRKYLQYNKASEEGRSKVLSGRGD